MENWKPVKNYENLYEVSDCGNVRSLDRVVPYKNGYEKTQIKKGKMLSQKTDKDGYKSVTLCVNQQMKCFRVHRLVAQAFIPNPNNLPLINHKDENPNNNHASNLEWCDRSYNRTYGTTPEKFNTGVICDGIRFASMRECSRFLNGNDNGVKSIKYAIEHNTQVAKNHKLRYI